ncbi:MAG: hypothetical protein JW994_03775 [Candidatus Omnitrophica bacterium]|nr:hypothetical protein [Candidatus Omnitrophota bacterium]
MKCILFISSCIASIIYFLTTVLYADIIYLKNGQSFEGEIIEQTDEILTVKEALEYGFSVSEFNKSDIDHIERTASKKDRIAKENFNNYASIIGGPFAYFKKKIKKPHYVLRSEYRIAVPKNASKTEIERIVREIVKKRSEQNKDIDEIIIYIYDDEQALGEAYTVGRAIWGIDGEFGKVTPELALSNDKSKHRISFDIDVGSAEIVRPDDRDLEIYYFYHKALWEDKRSPEQVISSKTAKKFGISIEELKRINQKVERWNAGYGR